MPTEELVERLVRERNQADDRAREAELLLLRVALTLGLVEPVGAVPTVEETHRLVASHLDRVAI